MGIVEAICSICAWMLCQVLHVWTWTRRASSIIVYFCLQDFDWNDLQKIPVAHGKTEHAVLDHDTRMELNRIYKICVWTGVGLSFVLLILWPCLALPAGVFSQVGAADS